MTWCLSQISSGYTLDNQWMIFWRHSYIQCSLIQALNMANFCCEVELTGFVFNRIVVCAAVLVLDIIREQSIPNFDFKVKIGVID